MFAISTESENHDNYQKVGSDRIIMNIIIIIIIIIIISLFFLMIIWIDISLHEPWAVVRVDSLSAAKSCLIHPLATLQPLHDHDDDDDYDDPVDHNDCNDHHDDDHDDHDGHNGHDGHDYDDNGAKSWLTSRISLEPH